MQREPKGKGAGAEISDVVPHNLASKLLPTPIYERDEKLNEGRGSELACKRTNAIQAFKREGGGNRHGSTLN